MNLLLLIVADGGAVFDILTSPEHDDYDAHISIFPPPPLMFSPRQHFILKKFKYPHFNFFSKF